MLVNWQCRRTERYENGNADRPNIIFLLADDLRYDALGCTGNTLAITPNLDKMAAGGYLFKNAYVTSSICAISRASILTGQYARRHGITNFEKALSTTAFQASYPFLLRQHGYYTGFIGKYGVGKNLPATAFHYWKGYPGHGEYFIRDANGNLVHETAMMGRQAKEFLEQRDPSKPFCLSISFKAPHSEDGVAENNGFRPDPFFNNWYTGVQFPLPVTYADSYYQQFPAGWRRNGNNRENEARQRWQQRFSPQKFQTTSQAIYRLVSGLDKMVGELREFLKWKDLEKNTILVFTSDNGFYMGEHGLEGKWYGHEESIRVPLIIYDPRQPQQQKIIEEMALNIDLAPTILSWADVEVPQQMQGSRLQPLLSGKATAWRSEFFYEHLYESGGAYIPKTVGVVNASWKYMRYFNGSTSGKAVVYEELFDVGTDHHEQKNLAKEATQKSRLDALRKTVAQYEQKLR